MGTLSVDIVDDSFSKKSSSAYKLSILLGVDRLSYLVYDNNLKPLVLKSYQLGQKVGTKSILEIELKKIFSEDKKLKLDYGAANLAIVNTKSTLIPDSLYEETEKSAYLDKMLDFQKSDNVKVDHLSSIEANNIFAINKGLLYQLVGYFPNIHVHHVFTPLLLGYQKIAAKLDKKKVFVNVSGGLVQVVHFDGENLVFNNSFEFKSSKDFIYYVLLVLNQFKLKPEEVHLSISGHVMEDSEVYHLLYRYVRHLDMVNVPSHFKAGKKFAAVPHHFYFDLYSLQLCG